MAKDVDYVGCCGAYCRTCKPLLEGFCKGCKLGYPERRDIEKAKCKIKLCCFKERSMNTCADCSDFDRCETIADFHGKNGTKYKKYKQSIEYIRENGYSEFLKVADTWSGAHGKLHD